MRRLAALAFVALLTGCASVQVQEPQVAGPAFAGPRLDADRVISFDGASLGLTTWQPASGQPWAVIVGVHGMDDYANAFHLAAPWWASQGVATYAYDQRGFGRSPERGVWGGDALMTEDLRTVVALVRARYPSATLAVVGESLGGAVAIETFASDRPPAADRLVLLAPAVWGWSTQPVAYKTALAVAAWLFPHSVLTPPSIVTDNIAASDNLEELEAMGRDPLMIWGARVDALYGLVDTMQHASEQIGKLKGPVLYLAGDHDQVITRGPAMAAVRRLPPGARTGDYADGWHLLMRDKEGPKVWADVAAFIRDPTAPLPSGVPPIHPLDGAAASR